MEKVFYLLILLSIVVGFGQADKYLSQKPEFLKSCKISESNVNECLTEGLQTLFVQWRNGVPGLNSVGQLDPLSVNRVQIAQDQSRALSIKMELTNVVVRGTSSAILKNARLDTKNWRITGKIFLPKMEMESDYAVKGNVLSLPLNGKGKSKLSQENTTFGFQLIIKLRDDGEFTFTEIESVKCTVEDIQGFHVRVDNLFNGQKELEDAANALFNENWRDIFESLRPAIEKTIAAILGDRLKKIFHYVPGNYFIEDLPKASQVYG